MDFNNATITSGPTETICEELLRNGAKMIATFEIKSDGEKRKLFIPIRIIRKNGTSYHFVGRAGAFDIKGEYSPRLAYIGNAGKITT